MQTLPNYPLSKGSGPINESVVSQKQLGDGYVQSAALAPDNLGLRYVVRYTARPLADVNAVDAFLRAHDGHDTFAFTMPGENSARVWRCEDWQLERISDDVRSLSATLIEVT